MQSELLSLSKIFSEAIFRIPDYQRGYAWQDKQVKDFWADIQQLEEGKNHYTGVLTLEPVDEEFYMRWDDDVWIIKSKKYTPLYVVDGQQRLTTAILLMQSLLDRISDTDRLNFTSKADIRKKFVFESKDEGISRSYIFGYEKDNPSYEYLKTEIFGETSEQHATGDETIYTKNLKNAKLYFAERIAQLDIKSVENLYTKLTQNLLFNIFYIEEELDVFITFETMNNRGKLLSHLELLKNRLIYLSTKINAEASEKERLRRTVNESWKTVYHYLGKTDSRILDDDTFLRTHFLIYFGHLLPKIQNSIDDAAEASVNIRRYLREDYYKDYLLDDIFSPKKLLADANGEQLTLAELHRYALDIKQTVTLYYYVFAPENSQFSNPEKQLLEQINRLGWYPARLFAVALLQSEADVGKRVTTLESLERYCFLYRFRPGSFSETPVEQLALKLKSGEFTTDEIRRKFDSQCDLFVKSTDFLDALQSVGKDRGYYGWNPIRYFMFEYEQWLRQRAKTVRKTLDWNEFCNEDYEIDHKTIEHIFPQTPTHIYWKDRFGKFPVKERNAMRNSLGNLLPLSQPKNASISNKPFPDKKGNATEQVGYKYGCLSEVQVAELQDWTPIEILKRGIRMLEFMELRWKFKLGSKEEKAKILGLTFILNREAIPPESL